jgi:hypothetical protein
MKALIHEMFGDGIMSAIDFEIDIQGRSERRPGRRYLQRKVSSLSKMVACFEARQTNACLRFSQACVSLVPFRNTVEFGEEKPSPAHAHNESKSLVPPMSSAFSRTLRAAVKLRIQRRKSLTERRGEL